MNEEYLKRVHTYLQQEIPEHKNGISLNSDVIIFSVPEETDFQAYYETVHETVLTCMSRIRDRQCDVNFTVKAKYKLQNFKVFKLDTDV